MSGSFCSQSDNQVCCHEEFYLPSSYSPRWYSVVFLKNWEYPLYSSFYPAWRAFPLSTPEKDSSSSADNAEKQYIWIRSGWWSIPYPRWWTFCNSLITGDINLLKSNGNFLKVKTKMDLQSRSFNYPAHNTF